MPLTFLGPPVARIVVARHAVLLREGLIAWLPRTCPRVAAAVGDCKALIDAVLEHALGHLGRRRCGWAARPHTRRGPARVDRRPLRSCPRSSWWRSIRGSVLRRRSARGRLRCGSATLKDRVAKVEGVPGCLIGWPQGRTVLDPHVVAQLLAGQRRDHALASRTDRPRTASAGADGRRPFPTPASAQRLVSRQRGKSTNRQRLTPSSGFRPDDPSTAGCSPSSPPPGTDAAPRRQAVMAGPTIKASGLLHN